MSPTTRSGRRRLTIGLTPKVDDRRGDGDGSQPHPGCLATRLERGTNHPNGRMRGVVRCATVVLMSNHAQGLGMSRHHIGTATAIAVASALLLTACGSSKPAYCSDVADFTNAIGQVKTVTSLSALETQVKNVVSTGKKALSAVKTSFAPQASAVRSSLTALENSVKQLGSSSTRKSALAAIPAQASAVKAAAQSFADAAKPKCG